MSTAPTTPGTTDLYDPKIVEILHKLREKTLQGKLAWVPWQEGFLTSFPEGQAWFNSTRAQPFQWTRFGMRYQNKVVLEISKTFPDALLMLGISAPVQKAAAELFDAVTGGEKSKLDKIIRSIDSI